MILSETWQISYISNLSEITENISRVNNSDCFGFTSVERLSSDVNYKIDTVIALQLYYQKTLVN